MTRRWEKLDVNFKPSTANEHEARTEGTNELTRISPGQ